MSLILRGPAVPISSFSRETRRGRPRRRASRDAPRARPELALGSGFWHPSSFAPRRCWRSESGLRARRADLRSEAEVGERALAVEVVDDPRHLAAAAVK